MRSIWLDIHQVLFLLSNGPRKSQSRLKEQKITRPINSISTERARSIRDYLLYGQKGLKLLKIFSLLIHLFINLFYY